MPRGRRATTGLAGATAEPGAGRFYMISVVSKAYGIHPQTLRLYEREGLLKPSRTDGNTRLYSEADLRELEVILNLTRELGVNLAGVEIVLNMRRKMEQMQEEVSEFVAWVRQELARAAQEGWQERLQEALVRLPPTPLARAATPGRGRSSRRSAVPPSSGTIIVLLRKNVMPATRKKRKPKGPPEGGERPRGREASLDSLNVYIRDIAKFKLLSADEEKELGRRIREGDQEAIDRLVEANLRFVVHYAKRYRGLGLSYMDLVHEGSLGLIEAAKRFDPERNVKFISYAVWWVRQAIFHSLSEHVRVFRLPQKLSGQVSRLASAREKLKSELERTPTTEELAERTLFSKEEVERLLLAAGDDVSLSTAVGDDGNLELGDTLEQDSVPSVEVEMIRTSFEQRIQDMVGGLDQKEREVMRMRFGLDGDEPKTLQEIGEAMGLSRERIRQIESRAKEKLRRSREAHGLRGYLN